MLGIVAPRALARLWPLSRNSSPLNPITFTLHRQGTTSNGDYLLPFKTGAFLAGVPVQPVVLHYHRVWG